MCRIISRIVLKAFVLLLFDFNAEAVDLKSIPYFEKAEAAEGGVFLLKVSIISEPRLYTLEELGIPYGESLVLNSKILLFKNIAYIPPGGGGYAYFSSRNKWVLHAVHYHDEIKSKVHLKRQSSPGLSIEHTSSLSTVSGGAAVSPGSCERERLPFGGVLLLLLP